MPRLNLLCLLLAAIGAPALAQTQAPQTTNTDPDIVVTGISLNDAKAALKACLDQHCPPDKDIAATLAVAETQFVAGDYKSARGTMLSSIGRNRRFAKQYPVPVSDLLRANSRVAAHLGEETAYRSGAIQVVTALKAGLSPSDPRVLSAQLELGDSYAKTGDILEAVDLYQEVASHARALKQPRNEGFALLRIARLYAALSYGKSSQYYPEALASANRLIARREPDLAPFVQAAKLLKANIAIRHSDAGAVDRLIEEYRASGAGANVPVALYAPKIELRQLSGREGASGTTLNQLALDEFDNQWVDVSFLVNADGKVSDAEVLRKSDKLSGDWVKPILTAVAARRYAPLAPDSPGFFRVERYSFTSAWTTVTGSRLRVRSPIPKIEMVDLSRDATTSPVG
jgi:tetratricopeptide (TPR) repeat protein